MLSRRAVFISLGCELRESSKSYSNQVNHTISYCVTCVTIANQSGVSSGSFSKTQETKHCCHFLITKCKIFKLLIKPLFLRLFEPDQSEIKEIFQKIVNIHNGDDF